MEWFYKKAYKEKFPPCIKAILEDTGYTTKLSLSKLQAETIKSIEDFVTSNKRVLKQLTCCHSNVYKKLDHFRFLPGHKSIILSLPNQIEELQMCKGLKTNKRANKKTKKGTKQRSRYSDDELKQKLVNLLVAASRRGQFQLPEGTISDANIIEFKRYPKTDENVCECKFSCPFCPKNVKVVFKTFWMSSNATKHLKCHI